MTFVVKYESFIVVCINGSLAIAAAVTNLLFVLAILKTPTLRTPSNILLCFLAFFDFGVGFVVQPLFITAVVFQEHATVLLHAMNHASVLLYGASTLTMTAIAVDRYLALKLHLRYQTIVTVHRLVKFKVLLLIICLGGYSFRFILPQQVRYSVIIIIYIICIFISSYCFIQIRRIVRRHRRQIIDQAISIARQFPSCAPNIKHGKSITTMYYIHGLFIFCAIPYMAGIALLLKFGESPGILIYRYCAWIVLTLNSVMNPFLYCRRIQGIKSAIKTLWKSIIKTTPCGKRRVTATLTF